MEMTELDPDYERLYRALQDHLSILPEAVGPGNILQGNQVCNHFGLQGDRVGPVRKIAAGDALQPAPRAWWC